MVGIVYMKTYELFKKIVAISESLDQPVAPELHFEGRGDNSLQMICFKELSMLDKPWYFDNELKVRYMQERRASNILTRFYRRCFVYAKTGFFDDVYYSSSLSSKSRRLVSFLLIANPVTVVLLALSLLTEYKKLTRVVMKEW